MGSAALLFTAHVTHPNFGPKNRFLNAFTMAMFPSISLEQLKLETSNLAGILNTWSTIENAKLGQEGREGGHMTYFWSYGTPSIFQERLS